MGGVSGTPGQVTITPVFWAPAGYSFPSSYKSILNGYLANVALASQTSTNVFSIATQYYQQALASGSAVQPIHYQVTAGGEIDDPTAFPALGGTTGCTADATHSACVAEGSLISELNARLTALARPIDDAHLYLVFFPTGVKTCMDTTTSTNQTCSTNVYCAYHGMIQVGGSPALLYGNQPYPDPTGCSDPSGNQAPNGDSFADAQVSLVSHEASEAITDSFGTWSDSAGYENGDECSYVYGAELGSTSATKDSFAAGTRYNQSIGTGKYWTQDEFSNQDFAAGLGDLNTTAAGGSIVLGCRQRDELPTAAFLAPTTSAGALTSFDGSTSSDPDNAAALNYSWNWGDGSASGSSALPTHVFVAPGVYTVTLTVVDGDGWSGSISHSVSAGSGNVPSAPSSVTGTPANGQVALTWIPPTSSGSSAIANYRVTVAGQPPVLTNSTLTSYTVTGLTNGTAYTFAVAAANGAGTGPDSTPSSQVTPVAMESLGGVLSSSPAATSWASNRTDVFVRGMDNGLYHRSWNGSAWSGWESLGGVLTAAPSAMSWGPNHIDVFVRGTDNGLWQRTWTGSGWGAWVSLGGVLTSSPEVSSWGLNRLDVFVRGTNGGLWHRAWSGTGWDAWEYLGGGLTADPAAVSWGPNHIDVFVRGTDNALWQRAWTGAAWGAWTSRGGVLASAPAASSCASQHVDVFALGQGSTLWQRGFTGSAWGGWRSLGTQWTADPAAVCRVGTQVVDLFLRGADAALGHTTANAS